jgi:hypothetical protein
MAVILQKDGKGETKGGCPKVSYRQIEDTLPRRKGRAAEQRR